MKVSFRLTLLFHSDKSVFQFALISFRTRVMIFCNAEVFNTLNDPYFCFQSLCVGLNEAPAVSAVVEMLALRCLCNIFDTSDYLHNFAPEVFFLLSLMNVRHIQLSV